MRALRPARAGGHRRSVVQEMPPGRQQKKSRDKGPLTRPGSPVIAPLNPGQLEPLVFTFPPLGSPLTASAGRPGPSGPPHFSKRPERVNSLFPQACVILGIFPRLFTIPPQGHSSTIFHTPPLDSSTICHTHTSRRQVEDLQVVGAARSVDKSTGFKTGRRQPQTTRKTCTKERFRNNPDPDGLSRV